MTDREILMKVCQFLQAPPGGGSCFMVNAKAWEALLNEVHNHLYKESP